MKGMKEMPKAEKIPKILAIVGPTASGKTRFAIKLAKKFKGELISADSRQIFKGMDIGTGKDKSYPQHLIDIVTADKEFSVADFQKNALGIINKILQLKGLPILVGGTGLYIDAVLKGYIIPPLEKESKKLRAKLDKLETVILLKMLKRKDPETFKKIDPHNKRRIIRALEVTMLQGRPFSNLQKKKKPHFEALVLAIDVPRKRLYQRIEERIDAMMKKGLVKEVKKLSKHYSPNLPSMSAIGYKEIGQYLKGKISLKQAIAEIKKNSKDFARRQLTWFKRDKNVKWVKNYKQAEKEVVEFLKG